METDANIRGEVFVFVQRLVDRIRAVVAAKARVNIQLAKDQPKPNISNISTQAYDTTQVIGQHRAFIQWFLKFIKAQLHPAAAYQRHIAGLRSLIILAKSGFDSNVQYTHLSKQALGDVKWSFNEIIFDHATLRLLQDLLMDPFDDVRSFAATTLAMQQESSGSNQGPQLIDFLSKAENTMLSSGRADHADGISRAYALLFETSSTTKSGSTESRTTRTDILGNLLNKLEETITLATENLAMAVGKFPMHGILGSIRSIILIKWCMFSPI